MLGKSGAPFDPPDIERVSALEVVVSKPVR